MIFSLMLEFFKTLLRKWNFFTDQGYQDALHFSLMIIDLFNDFYLNNFFVIDVLISFYLLPHKFPTGRHNFKNLCFISRFK